MYRDVFGEARRLRAASHPPSSPFLGLGSGTGWRLGGPGGAGGSVPVPHGSAPSVARLKSSRAGRAPPPAGSPPAEGLKERVPEPRGERKKKWRSGEPRPQPSPPAFPINLRRRFPARGTAQRPVPARLRGRGRRHFSRGDVFGLPLESANVKEGGRKCLLIWHLRCRLARGRYRGTARGVGQQSPVTTVP